MKISLVFLAISLGSLASQANTCFVATQATPSALSHTLCFENLNISENGGSVILSTEKEASVVKSLETTAFEIRNQESLKFEAKLALIEPSEGICYVGDSAVATLSGTLSSRFSSDLDLASLAVSVEYADSYDSCHLEPRKKIITYVLAK